MRLTRLTPTPGLSSRGISPQIDAIQEIWRQLRGPGGKGWPQLGQNDEGQNLTLVDAVAAIRQDLARIEKKLEER
ncbi:hypothetical protein CORTU0001_0531 [Corynebacterium tuberculostearicum SK141]|uniref:Uncharacterized protein n=1 Tax=Corynebacterium tuberculostearicum SK141 TaxID=553206 RepID=C6R9G8_9CORY|nr:hypothetical protein CORTU0001_0531 [Corynebacterium tuberculostearicum SK141]